MSISTSTMPSNSHPNVGYQVASKQELDVIYEGAQPRTSRTPLIVTGVVIGLVVVGGAAGVALWQIGLFDSDSSNEASDVASDSDHLIHSVSTSSPSPSILSTSSSDKYTNGENILFLPSQSHHNICLIS